MALCSTSHRYRCVHTVMFHTTWHLSVVGQGTLERSSEKDNWPPACILHHLDKWRKLWQTRKNCRSAKFAVQSNVYFQSIAFDWIHIYIQHLHSFHGIIRFINPNVSFLAISTTRSLPVLPVSQRLRHAVWRSLDSRGLVCRRKIHGVLKDPKNLAPRFVERHHPIVLCLCILVPVSA